MSMPMMHISDFFTYSVFFNTTKEGCGGEENFKPKFYALELFIAIRSKSHFCFHAAGFGFPVIPGLWP